nr:MAG TPA: hypothetical protein [Caudoviricetes sp.]
MFKNFPHRKVFANGHANYINCYLNFIKGVIKCRRLRCLQKL